MKMPPKYNLFFHNENSLMIKSLAVVLDDEFDPGADVFFHAAANLVYLKQLTLIAEQMELALRQILTLHDTAERQNEPAN